MTQIDYSNTIPNNVNLNEDKTYQHGELCKNKNGVTYRASCSGKAMLGIAPDATSVGNFWVEEETLNG